MMPNLTPPSRTSIRAMYLRGLFHSLSTLAFKREKTFRYDGKDYKYLCHPYNLTWMNERCVEVPIGAEELKNQSSSEVLEIGNVLSHYLPGLQHTIVDKYERGNSNVINIDAKEFKPDRKFRFIVSLSTFEHIGWDGEPKDQDKSWETIKHLSTLLAPGGSFLFTVPIGYHKPLEASLVASKDQLGPMRALKRVSASNTWIECRVNEAAHCKFGYPYPFANAIYIARTSTPLAG
jgi:hypothetical protein